MDSNGPKYGNCNGCNNLRYLMNTFCRPCQYTHRHELFENYILFLHIIINCQFSSPKKKQGKEFNK